MSTQLPPPPTTDVEDFRRLGVRPQETRTTVIRLAAARSAKTLAEQQLRQPSQQAALQLSRVATSAYRLLDPRFRPDASQRAHVGRIVTLMWNESRPGSPGITESRLSSSQAFAIRGVSDQQLIEMLDLDGPVRLEDEVQGYSGRRNRAWFRSNASAPRSVPKIGQRPTGRRQITARGARKWARRKWSNQLPAARWGALVLGGLLVGGALGWLTLRRQPMTEVVADAAWVDPVLTRSEIAAADDLQQFEISSESARSLIVDRRDAIDQDAELASLRQQEQTQRAKADLLPTTDLLPIPSLQSILSPLDEALDQRANQEPSGEESQDPFLADPFAKLAARQQADVDPDSTSQISGGRLKPDPDQASGDPMRTVSNDEDPPPGKSSISSEFEGRLWLDGRDLGVRLIYTEGVFISSNLFSQLADHVKANLQAAELRFAAEFELREPREVKVRLAVRPEQRSQTVRVDGQAVQFPALRSTAELNLDLGWHRIEWSFGNEQGRPISIRVRDAISLKRIPLRPATGSLPDQTDTVADWLTVKITDDP